MYNKNKTTRCGLNLFDGSCFNMSMPLYEFLLFDRDEVREIEEIAKINPKEAVRDWHLGKFELPGNRLPIVWDTTRKVKKVDFIRDRCAGSLSGTGGRAFLGAIPDKAPDKISKPRE